MKQVDDIETRYDGDLCALFGEKIGYYECDNTQGRSWYFEADNSTTGFWINDQEGDVTSENVWRSQDHEIIIGVDTVLDDTDIFV